MSGCCMVNQKLINEKVKVIIPEYPVSYNGHNQIPRCKQRVSNLQSSGVFDPRGSRQISMQAWLLGSLLAGINTLRISV